MTHSSPSELAQSIRDGTYFEESRKFYSEVYVSIISERVFYLVLTSVALLTVLLAISAVARLLPIVPAEPFLLRTNDAVHSLPIMQRLAVTQDELPDVALRRFFVNQYVIYRESYARDKIAARARAIYYWSTKENYQVYRRSIDTSNPRSPVVRYESSAEREIDVVRTEITPDTSVTPDPKGKKNAYIAKADFVAYVIRMGKIEPTAWTADLKFEYTDAVVDQDKVDKKTGKMIVVPMKFIVSSYVVRERKEEKTP